MQFPAFQIEAKVLKNCGYKGSALLVGAGACMWLWHWHKCRERRLRAVQKRQTEQDYIAGQLELLSREIDLKQAEEIVGLNGEQLLDQLQNGILKPMDVLEAYLYKACKVTGSINCVTDVIRECRETAGKLRKDNRKDLALYGMPISLKECFQTKGAASTVGLSRDIDRIAEEDCVLVKVLKHCGAVPFVKTNLSQMTMSFESSNPIYGGTSNPNNHDFSPGGSSGGEAALLGAGGSILGFGTDIGGSVRVPSHFCGTCGFKPTKLRLSEIGLAGPCPGQSAISATIGPMARDVDTLVMAMRALLCDTMFKLDPFVPPIKFRDEIYNSKQPLRIGYFEDNEFMEPVPACKRAVRITKQALERAGHTLVPFQIPDVEYAMEITAEALFKDGGQTLMEDLKYDQIDWCLAHTTRWLNMYPVIRKIYSWYLGLKSPRMAKDLMDYSSGDKSAYGLWDVTARVNAYKGKFWKEWREKARLDALICPMYPLVACPKGMLLNITNLWSYTVMFTLLNCPAGTLPVTKVTEKDIRSLEFYKGHFGDDWDMHVKQASKDSINMPVGVQCVAAPWQEELCLRLMKEVETLLEK